MSKEVDKSALDAAIDQQFGKGVSKYRNVLNSYILNCSIYAFYYLRANFKLSSNRTSLSPHDLFLSGSTREGMEAVRKDNLEGVGYLGTPLPLHLLPRPHVWRLQARTWQERYFLPQ